MKTNKTTVEKSQVYKAERIGNTSDSEEKKARLRKAVVRSRERERKEEKPDARSEERGRKEEGLTKVEVELLESSAHGPAAGALRNAAAVLLANEGLHASRTQATYAFGTGVALSQHAQSPAAGAVYLDGIGKHWRRV